MISFFIDTCSSISNIGLLQNDKLIDKRVITSNNDLSNNIFNYIIDLFNSNSIKVDDVKRIYVTIGPGSFTGIRTGVTIAKTFAWAKKIEIIPLSSLEVMASSSNDKVIIPCIDARRGYVFAGVYDEYLNVIKEDSYIELSDLKDQYSGTYIDNSLNIDIEKVISKHLKDMSINPHEVNPNYLKITEAEANRD